MNPAARRIVSTAAWVYVADQLTKILIRLDFETGHSLWVLPFFSVTHVENTGAAFGLFQGQNSFFIVSSLVILAALYFAGRHLPGEPWWSWFGQGYIWGGALGNLTDRLLRGHVTDFLDFFWGAHHWPSFNVADSAITVGAALLFIGSLF